MFSAGLTTSDIGELTTGALDILIATRVMQQRRVSVCPLDDPTCLGKYAPQVGRWPCMPPYSSSIEAAWFVVEELKRRGYEGDLNNEFIQEANIFHLSVQQVARLICKCALKVGLLEQQP